MVHSNKDDLSQNEAEKQVHDGQEGPFTPQQMRALKLLTGTMGVMIIICVILLGIGLSRQTAKLSATDVVPEIALPASAEIKAMSANGADGVWLYISDDKGESVRYIHSSGKPGRVINITRP